MKKMRDLDYLIYSTDKAHDGQSMRQYKTLRSYRLFYEGYVHNIEKKVQGRLYVYGRKLCLPKAPIDCRL